MGKYLLVYRGGWMAVTDEDREAQMAAWGSWFAGLAGAVLDAGNPFAESATVAADGSVTEGAGSGLGGYSIVSAASFAAATEIAQGCPLLGHGGTVDVYEMIVVI